MGYYRYNLDIETALMHANGAIVCPIGMEHAARFVISLPLSQRRRCLLKRSIRSLRMQQKIVILRKNDRQEHNERCDGILSAGFNSVRGRAAEVIGELIFFEREQIGHFLPALECLVRDPPIAVRAYLARTLQVLSISHPEITSSSLLIFYRNGKMDT